MLATVDIAAVPVLEGAAESIASGILSSLHSQNAQAQRDVVNIAAASQYPTWPLLFDPQTGALSIFHSEGSSRLASTFNVERSVFAAMELQLASYLDESHDVSCLRKR